MTSYKHDGYVRFIKDTIQIAENNGFRINESCRFSQTEKLYNKLIKDDSIIKDKKTLEKLKCGLTDFYQLHEILSDNILLTNARNEIHQILTGGNIDASDDRNNKPRDFQFQLFITSVYHKAYFPIEFEEPDFSMKFNNYKYYVAVKRLSSLNNIQKRIKEAKNQIEKRIVENNTTTNNSMEHKNERGLIILGVNENGFPECLEDFKNGKSPVDIGCDFYDTHIKHFLQDDYLTQTDDGLEFYKNKLSDAISGGLLYVGFTGFDEHSLQFHYAPYFLNFSIEGIEDGEVRCIADKLNNALSK